MSTNIFFFKNFTHAYQRQIALEIMLQLIHMFTSLSVIRGGHSHIHASFHTLCDFDDWATNPPPCTWSIKPSLLGFGDRPWCETLSLPSLL